MLLGFLEGYIVKVERLLLLTAIQYNLLVTFHGKAEFDFIGGTSSLFSLVDRPDANHYFDSILVCRLAQPSD